MKGKKEKIIKGKKKKERGKKEAMKGYKCSLHKSILGSLNKQLFIRGGRA